MRTLIGPLMALALLVLVIVHVEPAEAAVSTTPTEEDIWRQIQPPITGSNSGAQSTTALALTAGQTYFLYVGTNAAFGQYVNAGTSGNDLFSIDKFGVLTPGAKGPDAVLISMTNTTETYNPFSSAISPRVSASQVDGCSKFLPIALAGLDGRDACLHECWPIVSFLARVGARRLKSGSGP